MGDSKIQWTNKTWNPVTGCSKVSQGCKNCYAERIANRHLPGGGFDVPNIHGNGPRQFTDVRCHEDRLTAPLHWKKPARIFVNSMSDLFHEKVPFEFIDKVFAVMALSPQHVFQCLTKRPQRMLEYVRSIELGEDRARRIGRALDPFADISGLGPNHNMVLEGIRCWPLPNVWLGVSVEDQRTADERIPLLLQTPAAVRWISYEPALGPVRLDQCAPYVLDHNESNPGYINAFNTMCWHPLTAKFEPEKKGTADGIRWVVAGGESGPGARPMHPDWARSVRDQCVAAGVPFFFKQWGEWRPTNAYSGPQRNLHVFSSPSAASDGQMMERVGKSAAGRLLDGREWNEYPAGARAEAVPA